MIRKQLNCVSVGCRSTLFAALLSPLAQPANPTHPHSMASASEAKRQKLRHGDPSKPVTVSSGFLPALSAVAQQRVASLAAIADCEVDADGTVFSGLHKAYLAGASGVLR